jgi:hypothetical protein
MVIFGGLLIVFMGLGHNGIAGLVAAIARRILRLRAGAAPASVQAKTR